jgi:hypothetical protein
MTEYRSIVDPSDPRYRSKPAADIEQTMRDYNARGVKAAAGPVVQARPAVEASAFVWRNPATMPRRQWLYGKHYVRRFLSTTIAPGGVGKSSLAIVEALAMVTGRSLLGVAPPAAIRVWYWNGEDPLEETERRIIAAMEHFGIKPEEVEGRLFVDSGRDMEIVLAALDRTGPVTAAPVSEAMKATVRKNKIDVVIIDPFVSSHRVQENDNGSIDAVAKEWGRIAEATNCAVELVHHARKTGGAEVTVEDGRGAVALLSAARSGRALNGMTKDEAERAGVGKHRSFFRVDNGKANLAPPPEKTDWFQLVSVALGNGSGGMIDDGDHVAVVTPWQWPDPLADVEVADLAAVLRKVRSGRWRENHQCADWVGQAIAEVLELDLDAPAERSKVKGLLKVWLASGALVVREMKDETHRLRKYVEAGE